MARKVHEFPRRPMTILSAVILSTLVVSTAAGAGAEAITPAAPQIVSPIDENNVVILAGNTRPEASPQYDRGRVADRRPLQHLQLLLNRPDAQEKSLDLLIDSQTDRQSPNYHKWLTASEFGERFGVAEQDIARIRAWLSSHGFKVEGVLPSRMVIEFSGTAGDVREAFHTEIHDLEVNGVHHIANMSDPRIPAALAPAIAGLVSLNDFRPHPLYQQRKPYTQGTDSCLPYNSQGGEGPCYAVVPADLATIYNFNAAFSAGITGLNQTVVVIEDTDVYNTADWTTFRTTFGLSNYTAGTFTEVQPQGGLTCTDPGVNATSEREAIIDAEYGSAAAPDAAIVMASCADTTTVSGDLIALENLLGNTPLPQTVSNSHGECEAEDGAAQNKAYRNTYQQAAAEGVSIFASAGDSASADCDDHEPNATHGINANGHASTPYNVAVGGTDFGDAYANETGTYWSSTDSQYYGSALSYIPEIPWDDSCASHLIAEYYSGSRIGYGATGFCNSGQYASDFISTSGGGGAPSGCATGKARVDGVVSGTCKGWPKPNWQSGLIGIQNDNVRDLPDVSMFAASGSWSHFYEVCDSDGGYCTGAPSNWWGGGGTSFAAPIWAGIQALIDQKTGSSQGNPDPTLYALAAWEYGANGQRRCVSTKGNAVSPACVFYDVTEGDKDVNCTGVFDCYQPSGAYGVLSTDHYKYKVAYGATKGWDFATGLGTVNVYNLINAWPQ
jgi:subtilase family serine protease